jgi:hypothetical protein
MTFDDILAQVLELLKRQGRVSYSALKRRFDLDDNYLNDLKDELLFAHPVVDADKRGLIWTGDMASGQTVASQLRDGVKITSRFAFTEGLPSSSILGGPCQRRSACAF